MTWKPEVKVQGKWVGNAIVLATKKEAEDYAQDLMMRWTAVSSFRAVESDEPVKHSWVGDRRPPLQNVGEPSGETS